MVCSAFPTKVMLNFQLGFAAWPDTLFLKLQAVEQWYLDRWDLWLFPSQMLGEPFQAVHLSVREQNS